MEGSLYISVVYARFLKFTFYIVTVTHFSACIWFPLACYSEKRLHLQSLTKVCRFCTLPLSLFHHLISLSLTHARTHACTHTTHTHTHTHTQVFQLQLGGRSRYTRQLSHCSPRLHLLSLLGLCHPHLCGVWRCVCPQCEGDGVCTGGPAHWHHALRLLSRSHCCHTH